MQLYIELLCVTFDELTGILQILSTKHQISNLKIRHHISIVEAITKRHIFVFSYNIFDEYRLISVVLTA